MKKLCLRDPEDAVTGGPWRKVSGGYVAAQGIQLTTPIFITRQCRKLGGAHYGTDGGARGSVSWIHWLESKVSVYKTPKLMSTDIAILLFADICRL